MSNFSKLAKNNNDMSILRTSHDGNDNDNKNTENELSEIYTPETRAKAVTLLLYFSILMVLIPFSSMYFCYNYVFQVYDKATNTLYSGIVAIIGVYILVAVFIYIAYNDEKIIEKRLKEKRE